MRQLKKKETIILIRSIFSGFHSEMGWACLFWARAWLNLVSSLELQDWFSLSSGYFELVARIELIIQLHRAQPRFFLPSSRFKIFLSNYPLPRLKLMHQRYTFLHNIMIWLRLLLSIRSGYLNINQTFAFVLAWIGEGALITSYHYKY